MNASPHNTIAAAFCIFLFGFAFSSLRATAQTPEGAEPSSSGSAPARDEDETESANPQEAEAPLAEDYEPPEAPSIQVPKTLCDGREIRRIRIVGARRVDVDDLLTNMELRKGDICRDGDIAHDARTLWDRGVFDDIVVEGKESGQFVDIVIRVHERPAIGKLTYIGNDELDDDDFKEKVTLREGDILSLSAVQQQVAHIRDLYAEKGFFLAQIRYALKKLPNDRNEVDVQFIIEEGDEVTVRRIQFTGNRHVPATDLLKFMKTSESGPFSFLSSNNRFSRSSFDEDVQRVQLVYYDQGYLSATVGTPHVQLTPDRRFIDITIPITEGPRFRIGRLRVAEVNEEDEEIEPLKGRRELRKQVDGKPGDWFSRSKIAESLQSIIRMYRDAGYARVEVVPETNLDNKKRLVDVVVEIRRGPLVHIERINIQGNSRTRDGVIRRELRISEGDLYSQTQIEESKERVQALGYFERVDVSEEEGSDENLIVLNVEVGERSTGTFQVGAGFSSLETFILTAQIQQQNLFGNGQSLSLQLQLSGLRQLIQARFFEPYLFGTEWTGAVDAYKTVRLFQDFTRDATGGGLTIGHPIFWDDLRFFLQYTLEYVSIGNPTRFIFGGPQGQGRTQFRVSQLSGQFRQGITSSVRLSLTYDTRDNRLFPKNGIFATFSTEFADPYLGSQNTFNRYTLNGRFYKQVWGDIVFKTNAEFGIIGSRSANGVPLFERYFLGGIFNVRGFNLNSLGARLHAPSVLDPNAPSLPDGFVIGGNVQAYYNVELEFPIVESVGLRGVFFTDGGNAWNIEKRYCTASAGDPATDPCGVHPFRIRTSWGFGFRWISPLGPLRFEWGLPFRPRQNEDKINFQFTIGNFF